MNKEKALEGIENLIQEGNNVLKTEYNADVHELVQCRFLFHSIPPSVVLYLTSEPEN